MLKVESNCSWLYLVTGENSHASTNKTAMMSQCSAGSDTRPCHRYALQKRIREVSIYLFVYFVKSSGGLLTMLDQRPQHAIKRGRTSVGSGSSGTYDMSLYNPSSLSKGY